LLHAGGLIHIFTISPALPEGLTFDSTTGSITGVPVALLATRTFRVIGRNTKGNTTFDFNMTVVDRTCISSIPNC